jgi:hypothetical protein
MNSDFVGFHQTNRYVDFVQLLWLFNSPRETRDIIRLDLHEAGLLYKYASKVDKGNILEIGRYWAGSTVLLALATHSKDMTKVISIDCIEGCHDPDADDWLNQYPWKNRLDIRVGNSHTMKNIPLELLFVDGDHSYEGCKKDFDHHWNYVNGVCLCHDYTCPYAPGVTRCVDEYIENGNAKIIEQVGTMVALHKLKNI